ncbi:MAG: hydroxyacylglutathione hydrolase [Xanthomonadales bacterium]|nr:hydroxyacylglutathione hydrolase [Xanthomonadales bacterium]
MHIEQIWTNNAYRNFNYLIVCEETGEALAIDPLDYRKVLAAAQENDWHITKVLNTHEHGDHIGGNGPVIDATGARLLAHAGAKGRIPGIDRGLEADDRVSVGPSVQFRVLDTPGHTMSHVCLLSESDPPVLLCGDTLFNAGAGNCHNGGHPQELYHTFVDILARLPNETRVYPGHDYIANNLGFTLDREPENETARQLLTDVRDQDPADPLVTTLGQEKEINTFFRLQNPDVIAHLRSEFPDLPEEPDSETVFLKLRALRNKW